MFTIVKNGIYITNVKTIKQEIYEIMPDKKDIPFFEVKESSQEFDSMLVTGNVKDYPIPNDSYIVTAKELLVILQQMERFVQTDLNYDKVIRLLIESTLESGNYIRGNDLLNEIFENTSTKAIKHSFFNKQN